MGQEQSSPDGGQQGASAVQGDRNICAVSIKEIYQPQLDAAPELRNDNEQDEDSESETESSDSDDSGQAQTRKGADAGPKKPKFKVKQLPSSMHRRDLKAETAADSDDERDSKEALKPRDDNEIADLNKKADAILDGVEGDKAQESESDSEPDYALNEDKDVFHERHEKVYQPKKSCIGRLLQYKLFLLALGVIAVVVLVVIGLL